MLRKSSEARKLYHQIKGDSLILRHLPRKKPKIDLTDTVLGNIAAANLKIPIRPEAIPLPHDSQFSYLFFEAVAKQAEALSMVTTLMMSLYAALLVGFGGSVADKLNICGAYFEKIGLGGDLIAFAMFALLSGTLLRHSLAKDEGT